MADTVRGVEYYYATVPDAPGEGQRILSALKESGVNLLAFLGFPLGGGQAQIDLVPEGSRINNGLLRGFVSKVPRLSSTPLLTARRASRGIPLTFAPRPPSCGITGRAPPQGLPLNVEAQRIGSHR
jgi:hypothetical protein